MITLGGNLPKPGDVILTRVKFIELIFRLTNKTNVLDLNGTISEDEEKSLEKNIRDSRKLSKERIDKIAKELDRQ